MCEGVDTLVQCDDVMMHWRVDGVAVDCVELMNDC